MNNLREDLFVFIVSHGRSGSSALYGFLNLFSELNIAFEESSPYVFDNHSHVNYGIGNFSFNHKLIINNRLPYEFNGNKFVFNRFICPGERVIELYKRRLLLFHDRFTELKVIILKRNPLDTMTSMYMRRFLSLPGKHNLLSPHHPDLSIKWAVSNWVTNEIQMRKVESFFVPHFKLDFYDFVDNDGLKEDLINWIGVEFDPSYLNKKVRTEAYGNSSLSQDRMKFREGGDYKMVREKIEEEAVKILSGKEELLWILEKK